MATDMKRSDLKRAGAEPVCPECGARGDAIHKYECRIRTYLARVWLWERAK